MKTKSVELETVVGSRCCDNKDASNAEFAVGASINELGRLLASLQLRRLKCIAFVATIYQPLKRFVLNKNLSHLANIFIIIATSSNAFSAQKCFAKKATTTFYLAV